ncbi:MAG: hypothetical protein GY838_03930 [bacterium]|nr:hypothetical protein [bacterium]
MTASTLHLLHGIQSSSPAAFLSQISNAQASPNVEEQIAHGAGGLQPLFAGNAGQAAGFTFDCEQIKTLLDLTGVGMADLSAGNTDLYYVKAANLAARVAAASELHTRLRCASAGLVCNQITAGDKKFASASCRLVLPYDGSNEPIVPAGTIALSGTRSAAEHYKAGPIWLNASQIPGVTDVTIDMGLELFILSADGEMYPTLIAIKTSKPTVTFTCYTLPWTTIGLNGLAITGLSVYLRKYATAGAVANGTAGHIKFAATAGLATIENSGGGGTEEATTTVKCTLVDPSGTDAALTVNTAIAITT